MLLAALRRQKKAATFPALPSISSRGAVGASAASAVKSTHGFARQAIIQSSEAMAVSAIRFGAARVATGQSSAVQSRRRPASVPSRSA